MRQMILIGGLALAACAQPAAPVPSTPPPAAMPAAAVPTGDAEQRAARRLNRALRADDAATRDAAASPYAPRQTGEPGPAPFDVGGEGALPVMPDEVSPAFRGL